MFTLKEGAEEGMEANGEAEQDGFQTDEDDDEEEMEVETQVQQKRKKV